MHNIVQRYRRAGIMLSLLIGPAVIWVGCTKETPSPAAVSSDKAEGPGSAKDLGAPFIRNDGSTALVIYIKNSSCISVMSSNFLYLYPDERIQYKSCDPGAPVVVEDRYGNQAIITPNEDHWIIPAHLYYTVEFEPFEVMSVQFSDQFDCAGLSPAWYINTESAECIWSVEPAASGTDYTSTFCEGYGPC